MTAPVNALIVTKTNLTIEKSSNNKVHDSKALQRAIPKDIYFPRYKIEDEACALFYEAALTDIAGRAEASLLEGLKFPLSPEEKENVKKVLEKCFQIFNSFGSLTMEVMPQDIFNKFFNIHPELYSELEIIGSGAFKALGVTFCKRLVEKLLLKAVPNNKDKVAEILDQIFTPAFEAYLQKRINKNLEDIDYRLRGRKVLPIHLKHEGSVWDSINSFITILITKLPKLDFDEDIIRRSKALDLLKERVSHKNWDWLALNHPKFYYYIFKNLAFNKIAVSSKEGELLGILNIGKTSETTADLVCALDVPRSEIFPSVTIPCQSLLDPKTEDKTLYPDGENWVQAVFDKMTGRSRVNISNATDADLTILLCNKTKGEVNQTKSDKELVDIARQHSLNARHKIVRKVLKKYPELNNTPNAIFPYFLAQSLKDGVHTHLGKDPLAAMAIAINASEMIAGKVTQAELEIFIKEMNCYPDEGQENHALFKWFLAFSEAHKLEVHQSVARRIPLLKLCAFLHCQAEFNPDSDVQVYPRKSNESTCLEVIFKGEKRSYSLLLHVSDTSELIRDALNYLRLPRSNDEQQQLNRLIAFFDTRFRGPASSPMMHDLPFFNHKPEVFEKVFHSISARVEPLVFTNILFALQTQIKNRIPLRNLLINMPSMIVKMKDHLPFFFENLSVLLEKPEHKNLLQKFQKSLDLENTFTEEVVAKQWMIIMSQHADWVPFVQDCFVESIHQNPQVSKQDKEKLVLQLFDSLKFTDYRQALRLLQFIQQRHYVPFKAIQPMFKLIASEVLKNQKSSNFISDLQRLEIIAENIHSNKPTPAEAFVSLISPILPHSQAVKRINESYKQTPAASIPQTKQAMSGSNREKIDELIALAKTDYEQAVNRLFSLKGQMSGECVDRLLVLVKEILNSSCKDGEFGLAKSVLNNRTLNEWLIQKPESYMTLLLEFNEKSKTEQWVPVQDLALILVLKSGKIQNLSVNILVRLANQIIQTVKGGFSRDLADLKKLLIDGFNPLETALQSKQQYLKCIELFSVMSVYVGAEVNNGTNASIIVTSLTAVKDDEAQLKEASQMIESLIPALIDILADKPKKSLFAVIKKIISMNNQSFEKVISSVNQLSLIRLLDEREDLQFLFGLFKKFKATHPQEVIAVLECYTGAPQHEAGSDKEYRDFLLRFVKTKNWSMACRAMACNPFTCDDSGKVEELKQSAYETIQELLSTEKLSLSDLKSIFATFELLELDDLNLIAEAIEKSDGVGDVQIADKMWKIFESRFLEEEGEDERDAALLILTRALKFMNKESVRTILDNQSFIEYAAKHLSDKGRILVFKGLCKANYQLIKNAKVSEKKALYKQFDERAKGWGDCLWPDSLSDDRKTAVLDLLEIYASESGISLMHSMIDHLSSFGDYCDDKDRYSRQLVNALVKFANSTEHASVDNGKLSLVISNSIKENVPFLILARCLKHCHSAGRSAIGLKIVNVCLSVQSFGQQELGLIRNLRLGEFLNFLLNTKDIDIKSVETCIKHERLELFLKSQEIVVLQAMFSKVHFVQSLDALSKIKTDETNAIDFQGLVLSMEASADQLGVIVKSDENILAHFTEAFYKLAVNSRYNSNLGAVLLKMTQGDGGLDRWSMFVENLSPLLLREWLASKQSWKTALEFMIEEINRNATEALKNAKEIHKKQFSVLNDWIQTLFYFDLQTLQPVAEKFVEQLSGLLKAYPQEYLKIRMALLIRLRNKEECISFANDNRSVAGKFFKEIFKTYKKSDQHSLQHFYEDLLFTIDVVLSTHDDIKNECLKFLLITGFTCVIDFDDTQLQAQHERIIKLWLREYPRNKATVDDILELYYEKNPKKSSVLLKVKVKSVYDHLTSEPINDFKTEDGVYRIAIYFERLLKDLASINDQQLRNECVKELFDFYLDYISKVHAVYNSPRDRFDTFYKYAMFLIHLFSKGYPNCCILSEKDSLERYINQIYVLDLMCKDLPEDCQRYRNTIFAKSLPQIQKDKEVYYKRYRNEFDSKSNN